VTKTLVFGSGIQKRLAKGLPLALARSSARRRICAIRRAELDAGHRVAVLQDVEDACVARVTIFAALSYSSIDPRRSSRVAWDLRERLKRADEKLQASPPKFRFSDIQT
jgi:hypothetical protein